jgi:serine phosphatase RsbU (regulator of sigma subunit)
MQSNPECWLLTVDGVAVAQCLPNEPIGKADDGSMLGSGASLVVDCMGDMWFATFTIPDEGSAILGGELIEPGASCLLADGDNRLEIGGIHFVLRVSGASALSLDTAPRFEESSPTVSKHSRLLELFRDPAFHSGRLAEGMAKITFQAVEILGADRASLWLFDESGENEHDLELRARFTESSLLVAPEDGRVLLTPSVAERLCRITSDFLGTAVITADDPSLSPVQERWILDASTQRALLVGVGGGTEDCLGFLVMERILDAGEDWVPEDLLAAQSLAGLALHAIDAEEKKRALGRMEKAESCLAAELQAAGNYVQRILPPPIHSGAVRVDWSFLPSAQLGGDSFGYHWVGDRFFVCYLLDVVGHGSGAALLAISVSNAIRSLLLRDAAELPDPAAVLSHLNDSFPMEEQFDLTFSMWFGIFDLRSRELSFSSGGHPPALLICPESESDSPGNVQVLELGTEGVSVGSWADYPYATERVIIPPAAKLFVYSDGAYEIPLENGLQWSFPEFVSSLKNTAHMADGEVEYLRKRVLSLLGTPALPDDFCILRLLFDS